MNTIETKVCSKCKTEKQLSEFYCHKNRGRIGPRSSCKKCHSLYSNVKKYDRDRERKLKAIEHFGNKCHDCGGTFPYRVYDFHHVNGNNDRLINGGKTRNTPSYRIKSTAWDSATEEIFNKCIMLCANCHRIRHMHEEDPTFGIKPRRKELPRWVKPTACGKGHEFSGNNTYVRPNGSRYCKVCRTERRRLNDELRKTNSDDKGG